MPPEIPFRSQIDKITPAAITSLCHDTTMANITYLNLFNNRIKRIDNLQSLTNLQTLILAFNEIDEIGGLSKLTNLSRLDLNHNFIRTI